MTTNTRPDRRNVLWVAALLLAALLGVAFALVAPAGVARADTITTGNEQVTTADPNNIEFSLRVDAPAGLSSARLVYRVLNPLRGGAGGTATAEVSPGASIDLVASVQTRGPSRYIPVGSVFAYRWELEDTAGDRLVTDEQEYLFLDARYQWQAKTQENVTVYWYGEDEAFADDLLVESVSSLATVNALLNVTVDYPVRVLVWRSTEEGAEAVSPGRGDTENGFTRLGGQRVATDVVFVFQSAQTRRETLDTARHEVAHVVTHLAGRGTFSDIPAWLDEGTAVWAQTVVDSSYIVSVDRAVESDTVFTLRSINSPPGDNSKTLLFYGQAYAVVDFMITEYGEDDFAHLYEVIKAGVDIDTGLTEVYGLDQDTLYNEWRKSVGLPEIDLATLRASRQATAPPSATRAPLGVPATITGGGAASSGAEGGSGDAEEAPTSENGSGNTSTAIIVALITVVLAGALGGGGFVLLRRSKGVG